MISEVSIYGVQSSVPKDGAGPRPQPREAHRRALGLQDSSKGGAVETG